MENASKALIIAGAILLSILIIALGIYVFNMAKGATNTDQLDAVEKQTFNSTFTQYEGRVLGSSASELLNACISNATKNSEADDRLPDVIYLETRTSKTVHGKVTGSGKVPFNYSTNLKSASGTDIKIEDIVSSVGFKNDPDDIYKDGSFAIKVDSAGTSINEMGQLRNQMSPKHYYQVACHTDEKTGLIDCILIKY